MKIEKIRLFLGNIKFSAHAKEEMLNDEFVLIYENEVKEALNDGEIIETYPKDRPYPSFLIYGRTARERPLHIVSAVVEKEKLVVIITVYHPDPELWDDYRRRKI